MHRVTRRLATAAVGLVILGGLASCDDTDLRIERNVSMTSGRGTELLADVYRPARGRSITVRGGASRDPAIVLVHGGGWTGGDKSELADVARGLASDGFVAVSVNYDTDGPDRYPGQQADVQEWVRYVQQHAEDLGVDPRRVGVLGASAGGTLAMMVGVLGSGDASLPPVRAVASWSGASDLSILASPDGKSHPDDPPPGCVGQSVCIGVGLPSAFTDYLGCTLDACPERYAEASPITHVTRTATPMYLTASTDDFIPFDQSERMAGALRALGVTATTAEVPGAGHAQSLAPDALDPTIEFFRQQLR